MFIPADSPDSTQGANVGMSIDSEPHVTSATLKFDSCDSVSNDTAATASVSSTSNNYEVDVDELEEQVAECPPPIPPPATIKKNVSFGHLDELSFEVVKGDPNIEMGYPMTLGWDCLDEKSHTIDAYEANRPSHSRRSSDQMRTMTEERRKIIKDSKKRKKHRRRDSIGNGQIAVDPRRGLIPSFLLGSVTSGTDSPPTPPHRRGTLRRQNSIGNGEMTRDPRRNTTQGFLLSLMTSAKQTMMDISSDDKKEVVEEKKDNAPEAPTRRVMKRQNSIGNGEISRRLSSDADKAAGEDRRGGLRRQNSIGNGEISRRSSRVQGFMQMMSFKQGRNSSSQ